MKFLLSSILAVYVLIAGAQAQQIPTLDFFHGRECPHCQNEKKWLPQLKLAYPDIVVNEYEVWHDPGNQALMRERLSDLGAEASGVPVNIINDQVIVGFLPDQILSALEAQYGAPALNIAQIPPPATPDQPDNYKWAFLVLTGFALAGGVLWLVK